MPSLEQIAANVAAVHRRVQAATAAAGRPAGSTQILLATKTQPISAISAAIIAMHDAEAPILLGENRVQELTQKAGELVHLPEFNASGELHFIGNLQKNKVNQLLATPVVCVQTVDTLDIARVLSERLVRLARQLQVMVQVNVSGEPTKAGCLPELAVTLAGQVAQLPCLQLTGFMCLGLRPVLIDGEISNAAQVSAGYQLLREIRDQVIASDAPGTADARQLSMGMSTDLELAIAQGATIVRVGTGIFGSRP